jgi:hypothetical protein
LVITSNDFFSEDSACFKKFDFTLHN